MEIRTPAKINLFLGVRGRRSDGYHELLSLMCPITLYDHIRFEFFGSGIRVRCSHPDVPEDETNLVSRAARAFYSAAALPETDLSITIEKKIPVAAGLGGGSSDAAAVLLALNQHHGGALSKERLMAIGGALGADVPFFILGKPAVATGIGDRLEPAPGLPPYPILLLSPPISISTAQVYKNLNLALTKCKKLISNWSLNVRTFDAARHLCNDLESVTASICPDIIPAKASLMEQGAINALMTGSGPVVFGLFAAESDSIRAEGALSEQWKGWGIHRAQLIV